MDGIDLAPYVAIGRTSWFKEDDAMRTDLITPIELFRISPMDNSHDHSKGGYSHLAYQPNKQPLSQDDVFSKLLDSQIALFTSH